MNLIIHELSYKIFYLFLHAHFTETVKIVQKLEKMMLINMVKKIILLQKTCFGYSMELSH